MSYTPFLPLLIDHKKLIGDCVDFFPELTEQQIRDHFRDYRKFHVRKNYEATFGEIKTLAFEEAFVLYLVLLILKPANLVEVGSQHGKSARRILDMVQLLGLSTQMTCFDIDEQLKFVTREEVQFSLHDVANDFDVSVLSKLEPSVIHLDAHPYHLTRNAVEHFLRWSTQKDAIMTLHDCGRGLYNPNMSIPKERPELVTSHTGCWERHVLADVFAVDQAGLDDVRTESHKLRIFQTRHGLAAIRPNRVLFKRAGLNEVGDSNQKEVPSPFQGEG